MPATTQPETRVDIDALRTHIGAEHISHLPDLPDEPVRRVDIRGYAEAIADDNPLWDVLAPPGFMEAFAPYYRAYHRWSSAEHQAHAFPFEHPFADSGCGVILLSEEIFPLTPVRPGDVVVGRSRVTDIQAKRGAVAGQLVIVTYEKTFSSPNGDAFGRVIWNVAASERQMVLDRSSGGPVPEPPPRDERLARRPSPRQPLDELPTPLVLEDLVQPIEMTMLAKWSAVMWDMGAAHLEGAAPLAHGPLLAALHRRVLTDWLWPGDQIEQHRVALRGPCVVGDVVSIATSIDTIEREPGGDAIVAVSSTMTNHDGATVSVATGRCRLRGGD